MSQFRIEAATLNMAKDLSEMRQLIDCFRVSDLKTLLGAFDVEKTGLKNDLQERTVIVMGHPPHHFKQRDFLRKMLEIYCTYHYVILPQIDNSAEIRRLYLSPQFLANKKFGRFSPFDDDFLEIVGLKRLLPKNKISIAQGGLAKAVCRFTLNDKHYGAITNDYCVNVRYEVQLRIGDINSGSLKSNISDYIPKSLRMMICGFEYQPLIDDSSIFVSSETRRRIHARPIDCTPYVKYRSTYQNTVELRWLPDGTEYVYRIDLVKKVNAYELLNKLRDRGSKSTERTRNLIISILNDAEMPNIILNFMLDCPLTKNRICTPAKSSACQHLQCFDAYGFIAMNERKPTWRCPICNIACHYDDLIVDHYFLKVIKSMHPGKRIRRIQLMPDGNWIMIPEHQLDINTVVIDLTI